MPSIQAQFNEEVIQAHREALSALRDLLAVESDPLERRRLAVAILRTRPVTTPDAPGPSQGPGRKKPAPKPETPPASKALHTDPTPIGSPLSTSITPTFAGLPAPNTNHASPATQFLTTHAGTQTPIHSTPRPPPAPPRPKNTAAA